MLEFIRGIIMNFRSFLYDRGFYLIHDSVRNTAGACFSVWILIGALKLSLTWAAIITIALSLVKEVIDVICAHPCETEYLKHEGLKDMAFRSLGIVLALIPFWAERGYLR